MLILLYKDIREYSNDSRLTIHPLQINSGRHIIRFVSPPRGKAGCQILIIFNMKHLKKLKYLNVRLYSYITIFIFITDYVLLRSNPLTVTQRQQWKPT